MKKLFFIIATFLFATSAIAGTPSAQDFGDFHPIIIRPFPPLPPNPRSMASIECTYSSSKESIETIFYENLGEMTIVVMNHSTGEQWTDYADTSTGSWDIYISSSHGEYSIILKTKSGDQYGGTFSL